MIGCTQEEALDLGPNELLAPEDRERVIEIHYKRMRGEIDNMCYNASLLHKSGRRIAVEFHSTTVKFNSENASYITMRDITLKNTMEKALRQSEQKYRQLAEMLPQTIYELDANGNITYFNQTGFKKFGIAPEDLSISAFNFIVPEEHEKMRANMRRSLDEGYQTAGNRYTAVNKRVKSFQ
ncbi:MAG: PAS domain S-box protein [Bacteroidales bacterium]|nr:PAS domain S-box protein [Bacteroidales bacterium]